jgi:hypothetical protein
MFLYLPVILFFHMWNARPVSTTKHVTFHTFPSILNNQLIDTFLALEDAVRDDTSNARQRGPISTQFIPSHFSHNDLILHLNIILQLTPSSIKWLFPLKFYVLCVLHMMPITSLHFKLTGSSGPGCDEFKWCDERLSTKRYEVKE